MSEAKAMAAENSRKRFRQEVTCPICLRYFRGPVMLECGHNFCEICISQCWQEPDTPTQCPQCRGSVKKHFKPNRCLMNMVEILNDWDMESEACSGASECQQHRRPLSLFCKEDQALLCGVCEDFQEHLGHKMAPMEEAAQEYKDQMRNYLEILRKAKVSILDYKGSTESQAEYLIKWSKDERELISASFSRVRQYLEVHEKLLVTQIDEVLTEITQRRDKHLVRISKELFSLERLIWEIEEKCQQPASKLLQDIQSTLVKYEERQKFETSEVFPPELKLKTWEYGDLNNSIRAVLTPFAVKLETGLRLEKVNLTFGLDYVNPTLTVSEDWKSVKQIKNPQDLPANQQKLDPRSIAFGHTRLTTGRLFWDITLENAEHWAVGILKESAIRDLPEFIMRKGCSKADSKKGIWALQCLTGCCCLSGPGRDFFCLKKLKRVRVILNFTEQGMSFLSMDHGKPIWCFRDASLSDK